LQELITMQVDVVGVCTLAHSAFNADHMDLTPIAVQAGIPVPDTAYINSLEALNWIQDRKPDVSLVVIPHRQAP
jgi:methionyl-tRNA formyltransferase